MFWAFGFANIRYKLRRMQYICMRRFCLRALSLKRVNSVKRRLFLVISMFYMLLTTACGESEQSYPMCDCKADEICVDEICSPTTPDIIPAPKDKH